MKNGGLDFNLTLSNSIFTEIEEYGWKVPFKQYEKYINIFHIPGDGVVFHTWFCIVMFFYSVIGGNIYISGSLFPENLKGL